MTTEKAESSEPKLEPLTTTKRTKDSRIRVAPLTPEEASMVSSGLLRYREQQQRSGHYGSRQAASFSMLHRFGFNIQAWLDWATSPRTRVGRGVGFALVLADTVDLCGMDRVALLVGQTIMDGGALNATAASVSVQIGRALEQETRIHMLHRNSPETYAHIIEKTKLAASRKLSMHLNTAINQSRNHNVQVLKNYKWSTVCKAHLGLVLLHLFKEASGFIRIDVVREYGRTHGQAKVVLTESFRDWQGSYDERRALLRPRLLPTPYIPKLWAPGNPYEGGYYTPFVTLVKTGASEDHYSLEHLESLPMGPVLNSINRMQTTAWAIDKEILALAEAMERNPATYVGCPESVLPPQPVPYPLAEPNEASRSIRFRRARYYLLNSKSAGRRIKFTRTLETARAAAELGDPIYFPINMDYRSRVYPASSGLLSFQGSDLSRGLLRLAQGEPLTGVGRNSLLIHAANLFGLDKRPYAERAAWANENLPNMVRSGMEPEGGTFWMKADKPWQFLSVCKDLYRTTELGQDSTSLCMADASASGFQMLALLTGNERLAHLTNLTPSESRQDLYSHITELVIPEVLARAGQHKELGLILDRGLSRDIIKPAIMAVPYGISVIGVSRLLATDLMEWLYTGTQDQKKVRDYLSGTAHLAVAIHSVLTREFPEMFQAMRLIKAVARLSFERNGKMEWTTPSGFPWRQAIMKTHITSVRPSLGKEKLWVDIEDAEEGALDVPANISAAPANFIHSLDAAVIHNSVHQMPPQAPIATVHDCIGTSANYMETFKLRYRQELRKVFDPINPLVSLMEANGLSPQDPALADLTKGFDFSSKKIVDVLESSPYCIS